MDNNITTARIKRVLSPKVIAIVFLIVTLVTVVFYVTLENIDKKEVQIWFVTTDSEYSFSDDTLKQINDYGTKHGIDKVVLSRRHPEDIYFDVTMSTSAYYNCDVFIMNEEMAKKYYPRLWAEDRIEALYKAGKLTEEEYASLMDQKDKQKEG